MKTCEVCQFIEATRTVGDLAEPADKLVATTTMRTVLQIELIGVEQFEKSLCPVHRAEFDAIRQGRDEILAEMAKQGGSA